MARIWIPSSPLGGVRMEIKHLIRLNVLEGKIEGKSPRGGPRDKYTNQIKKDTGKKRYQDVVGLEIEREEWKTAVNQSMG
ncbi:hypothetical protein J437_LFUL019074 [Ladona fulva]|uniref:Uncharacterized protein n=1 Tax=Ladona fulva TaxID=123851 RepID=A0A8K0NYY9_LADFU|nr:hypothetical protein J437_LFUL019074 [Ladona fulva]